MPALVFPSNPTLNQTYSAGNNTWYWSGLEWKLVKAPTGTPNVYRWKKTAVGGETVLSGNDDTSLTLSYTVGTEQVYKNGLLLIRGVDYTASTGTSITLTVALTAGQIIQVLSYLSYTVSGSIPLNSFTAKGDILVGTSASVNSKLSVGTNGYILTADSTTGTGVAWKIGPISTVALNGTALTQRPVLNFIGSNVTITDDVPNNRTNVTITSNLTGYTLMRYMQDVTGVKFF